MKTKMKSSLIFLALGAMMMSAKAFSQQPSANTLLGTADIPSYIEGVPGLPGSLEEAAKRAFGGNFLQPDYQAMDNYYLPAEENIRRVQLQYEDHYKKQMEGATPDRAAINQEIERNPIIKSMGGVQAIQGMNQEEAEDAARQATEQYLADPFSASGVNSPGMTALYQKMMNDPAYAARFQQMSEQERMAELQKYMANDPAVVKTPEMARQMSRKETALNAMEINGRITEFTEAIQAAANAFGQGLQTIENPAGNHNEIDAEFKRKYNALPEVIAGEVGRIKDPEPEKKLRVETAVKHRERAAAEMEQITPLFQNLKEEYRRIAASYMEYIAANIHKVNGDMAGLYDGTNTELNLANFESSLLGLGLELIKQARTITGEMASWERQYMEVMRSYGQTN